MLGLLSAVASVAAFADESIPRLTFVVPGFVSVVAPVFSVVRCVYVPCYLRQTEAFATSCSGSDFSHHLLYMSHLIDWMGKKSRQRHQRP